jgi:hypothetical protein
MRATERALKQAGFEFDELWLRPLDCDLTSTQWKVQKVQELKDRDVKRIVPILAIDDDDRVCEAYRAMGIPTLHVAAPGTKYDHGLSL